MTDELELLRQSVAGCCARAWKGARTKGRSTAASSGKPWRMPV